MRLDWKGQPVQIRELGQGPAVILVHGYPLDGAMWSGVARTLSSRFRVLKPDLPGRGENPTPPEGTIDSYADFLQAILGEIPPPAGLAGFSMGGYASLALRREGRTASAPLPWWTRAPEPMTKPGRPVGKRRSPQSAPAGRPRLRTE